MKVLIAVKSCQQDMNRGYHSVIRETWGKDVKAADLRFFVGREDLLCVPVKLENEDEVLVDCFDDYDNLPYKTREILKWSGRQDYDFTFLCDTDTFLIPARLMKTGFEKWDYSGKIDRTPGVTFQYNAVDREKKNTWFGACYPWASGGFGYFLSKEAAAYVTFQEPDIWAEDLWVGQLMGPIGRFNVKHLPDLAYKSTWHCPENRKGNLEVWMREMYETQR